jgi:hypothetical protein
LTAKAGFQAIIIPKILAVSAEVFRPLLPTHLPLCCNVLMAWSLPYFSENIPPAILLNYTVPQLCHWATLLLALSSIYCGGVIHGNPPRIYTDNASHFKVNKGEKSEVIINPFDRNQTQIERALKECGS